MLAGDEVAHCWLERWWLMLAGEVLAYCWLEMRWIIAGWRGGGSLLAREVVASC